MYKFIKHRGIHNKEIKENSYDAILLALESDKYIGVEFDVRETKDHEFIIHHDPILNNKLISDTLYKDLPKYVPRLNDILKINSNKMFLIEIKNISSFDNFINLLEIYKNKNLYVMSFSNKLIEKVDREGRNYKIGILNYVLNTNKEIKKLDFVCILNSLLNDEIIRILKGHEIFSYGLFEHLKFKDVFYIVDN